jgi:hypothetical protein
VILSYCSATTIPLPLINDRMHNKVIHRLAVEEVERLIFGSDLPATFSRHLARSGTNSGGVCQGPTLLRCGGTSEVRRLPSEKAATRVP